MVVPEDMPYNFNHTLNFRNRQRKIDLNRGSVRVDELTIADRDIPSIRCDTLGLIFYKPSANSADDGWWPPITIRFDCTYFDSDFVLYT